MSYVDPSLELQKAIVAALKADAAVTAIINGRIYDAVPGGATKPYVSFGPFQLLPEHGDCLYGGEAFNRAYAGGDYLHTHPAVRPEERKARLKVGPSPEEKYRRTMEYLQREVWPFIPLELRGKAITKEEEEEILGIGPNGYPE